MADHKCKKEMTRQNTTGACVSQGPYLWSYSRVMICRVSQMNLGGGEKKGTV